MPDDASDVRLAKLFLNGRSQSVRIPSDMRFPGTEVTLRKVGEGVLIEPVVKKRTFREALLSMKPLPPEEWFELPEDPPPEPVDL
ncbi:AbrB/MazE/SpoVT family DNA-binding domain-containing protein [Caulobacter sp. SLTY]|uniref:antitoxin n=1 Tax=Caulobacter sp. SLTY TaxID=2683262 RepID=UPI0014133AF0|nr:AbrB/MazE/SpoVT family DNA-binding domain-containing protein [Caulobacter sp. SLTY]NBB16689.1 AbrB/MazE/SpoVT family DNA-binding domain-containing protein [Caulobacter sp. SLTY]